MTVHLKSSQYHDPVAAAHQVVALAESTTRADLLHCDLAVPAIGGLAVPGEILVAGHLREVALDRLAAEGFDVVAHAGTVVLLANPLADQPRIDRLCTALRRPGLDVAPNYVVVAAAVGKFAKAGPLPTMSHPARDPEGEVGRGVRVAVVDVAEFSDGGLLSSAAGHATFVAGLVRGLAPGADVQVVAALDADGIGTDFDVARALFDLAAGEPPALINLSLTAIATSPPLAMTAALTDLAARHPEVLVVAAAGNDHHTEPVWPAAAKTVLAVGAPAAYSNRGWWVDFTIAAEGVIGDFPSGVRDSGDGLVEHRSGHTAWSGTSFAAPQVTGALAALLGRGLAPADAVARLRRTAAVISASTVS